MNIFFVTDLLCEDLLCEELSETVQRYDPTVYNSGKRINIIGYLEVQSINPIEIKDSYSIDFHVNTDPLIINEMSVNHVRKKFISNLPSLRDTLNGKLFDLIKTDFFINLFFVTDTVNILLDEPKFYTL